MDQSLKIKLNQFMLAYQRQCSQLQYQRQNIKQNVMLSIIQLRNPKKNINTSNNNSQLNKSVTRQKVGQNLASSKETKLSEQKYSNNQIQQHEHIQSEQSQIQRSKLLLHKSKLMQRSNIKIKSNKSNHKNMLTNNFMNQVIDMNNNNNMLGDQQQIANQPIMQKSIKNSAMFNNNPYCFNKDKNIQVTQINNNDQFNQDSNIITFKQNKSVLHKNPSNLNNKSILIKNNNPSQINNQNQQSQINNQNQISNQNRINNTSQLKEFQQKQQINLTQSSISKRNQKLYPQNQIQKQLEQVYLAQENSNVFQKNSKVYPNSQKAIKPNPSAFLAQNQMQEQQYPTFKRPSFQFITNMDDLRQSNPNEDQEQNQQAQNQYDQQENNQQQTYGKWNSRKLNNQQEEQRQNQFQEDNNNYFEEYQPETGQQQNISHIQQDQSMMMASQFNQRNQTKNQEQRKSYLAFQINMQKSNLPSAQSIQELKKKKILQLQRKRQQRMQNNSKKKQNPSQISNNSKQQKKQQSSMFVGPRNSVKRQNDNRDSLNKSINQRKNDRPKNFKNNNFREEQSCKESVFHDNKTIITKYGDQSRINNRSTSPLNTVKTIQTDKRPPLNKNRKDDNIFAGQSTFQREKSSQKLSADPKIVPIDMKSKFQKKSNIKIMVNAITYTCLPGELNRRQRQKLIDVLQGYENQFFLFLFKEYSRKVIKGIYILDGNQQKMMRIYGQKGPSQIYPQQVHEFYRFDSGSREFKKIDGCKSFSFSIHAVDLK